MGLGSHAAAGAKWNSLASASGLALQIVRSLVLARLLEPADFGLIAMTMTVISLASVYADAGVSLALLYRLDATKAQLSSLFWFNVACSSAVFLLLCLLAPIGSWFFGAEELTSLIRVMACVFLIAPLGQQMGMLLNRDLRFSATAKIKVASDVSGFAAVVALALAGFGYWAMAISFIVGSSVSSALLLLVGWSDYRPSFHFRWAEIRSFVSFGALQLIERTLDLLEDQSDQIILGRLLGPVGLGYYSFAKNLANLPVLRINPVLMSVALPIFARIRGDRDRLRSAYMRVVGVLLSIDALLLVGAAASAPLAIPVMFGEKWSSSVPLFQVLALVGIARAVRNPAGSLAFVHGRAAVNVVWNAAFIVISAPLIYLAASRLGSQGAANASAVLFAAAMWPMYRFLVRPYIGPCGGKYFATLALPVLLAVAASIPAAVLSLTVEASWRAVALQAASGMLLSALLYWRLRPDLVAEITQLLGRSAPVGSRSPAGGA